jgi:hypothetical protein
MCQSRSLTNVENKDQQFNMDTLSITELTKTTAENIYNLLMQLGNEVDRLTKENADLKDQLKSLESKYL